MCEESEEEDEAETKNTEKKIKLELNKYRTIKWPRQENS